MKDLSITRIPSCRM